MQRCLKHVSSVTWKDSRPLVFHLKPWHHTVFMLFISIFEIKILLLYVWVWLNKLASSLESDPLSSQLTLLGISCNPVQGYRVLDIYNLLLHHWLTLHGCTGRSVHTLYARWWRAPDLPSTLLIPGVTLCVNSFSTVESRTPPHHWGAGWQTRLVKTPYGWRLRWKSNHSLGAPDKSSGKALFQSKL